MAFRVTPARVVLVATAAALVGAVATSGPTFAASTAASVKPVARLTLTPSMTTVGKKVTADPGRSSTPKGLKTVTIDFGDRSAKVSEKSKGKKTHVYAHAGTFTVTLKVTDRKNVVSKVTKKVMVMAATTSSPTPAPTSAPATASATTLHIGPGHQFVTQGGAIHAGELVTVVNDDADPHTFTADSGAFDTGTISPGRSKTFKAPAAGSYAVSCQIHPDMHTTLTVS